LPIRLVVSLFELASALGANNKTASSMARVPLSQLTEATARNSSPPAASDSDKENPRSVNKRNTRMTTSSQTAKRRRLTDRTANTQSQIPPSTQRNNSTRFYDPDQDEEERRHLRKQYRDLTGDFNGTLSTSVGSRDVKMDAF
jgi:hypothetical protein